jgi:hypothetical protein
MNIEVISCSATAAATTGTAATAFSGDSLTIKNAKQDKPVDILAIWQTNQTAGFGQVAFPSGHDTTRGYRASAAVGVNPAALPLGMKMRVQPQELLSVTLAATAVAGDVENYSMLVRYGNLPGVDAQLITAAEVERRQECMTTIDQSITSAAGPGYSGEVAINTASDLLKANRNYEVLGMYSRTAVHALTLRGPDLGNVRVACPGVLREELVSQWFMMLSRAHGEALVPVINSGNKASTFMGVATDENGGTFVMSLFLALLK